MVELLHCRRAIKYIVLLALLGLFCSGVDQSFAFVAEDVLSDPGLESRAISVFKIVRCMVCSGNSIYDSDSEFAADLRQMIRTEIATGKSDDDVLKHLVSFYGDKIVFQPKVDRLTIILWMLPIVIVIFGTYFILRVKSFVSNV